MQNPESHMIMTKPTTTPPRSASLPVGLLRTTCLLMLCAAYLQGAITKFLDFDAAIAEMQHFRLHPAGPAAAALIVFEIGASAMVVSGFLRWIGALALAIFTLLASYVALRFWELPSGMPRTMAMNAFFEHVGLAGAFLLVAGHDLLQGLKGRAR